MLKIGIFSFLKSIGFIMVKKAYGLISFRFILIIIIIIILKLKLTYAYIFP